MSLGIIDFRHLRYFVAVAQQRSFRAAALLLHVSQPPLTRQIHQLEEALGVLLLDRKPRGVELTEAGRVLLTEAQNILALTEQALVHTRLAGQGQLGRLDIGVFGSAILDIIPRIVLAFRKAHPKVEIVMHNLDREGQLKALRERRIMVGFNRFFGEEPDLQWETLLSERMLVAVPMRHGFADRKQISLKDLRDEPLVFYPRPPRPGAAGFVQHLLRMFHQRGITPNVAHEVDDVVTAVALVSSGLGLCMVVESAKNLRMPGVVYVPLPPEDRVNFDLCMIRRNEETSPLLDGFMAVARSLFHEESAKRPRASQNKRR